MAVLHSDSTLKIVYQARTCNRKSDWLKNKITLINADSSTVVLPPPQTCDPWQCDDEHHVARTCRQTEDHQEIPIDWTAQNINSNDILISFYTCKCTMNIQLRLDQVSELRVRNTSMSTSLPPWEEASPEYRTYTPTSTSVSAALDIDSL